MKNIQPQQPIKAEGRRALKVRDAGMAKMFAVWLSKKSITPNQISIASVGFAALAALALMILPLFSHVEQYSMADYSPNIYSWLLPLLAALFIQCRLLCNLFDGMVAMEGGKSTASGELFNDIPDRIADPLILVSAGYAIGVYDWGLSLGWCAGLLAVMTAYIRTLATSIGAPVDFQGPMAKQHRMALMTFGCLFTAFEGYFWMPGFSLTVTLGLIVIGCVLTCFRRSRHAYLFLENQSISKVDK
jgi:phosphatidylglycerophosphate synthase